MRCPLKFGTGKSFKPLPRLELSSNLVYPAIRYVQRQLHEGSNMPSPAFSPFAAVTSRPLPIAPPTFKSRVCSNIGRTVAKNAVAYGRLAYSIPFEIERSIL
jgi:hypothetical protein